MEGRLLEALKRGKENATKAPELAEKLELSSTREVGQVVHNARLNGVLICSGSEGYWLPDGEEELQAFYRNMQNRAISCFRAAKSAREELRKWKDQMAIDSSSGISD